MANMRAWGACDSGFESQCPDQVRHCEFCGQFVCSFPPTAERKKLDIPHLRDELLRNSEPPPAGNPCGFFGRRDRKKKNKLPLPQPTRAHNGKLPVIINSIC